MTKRKMFFTLSALCLLISAFTILIMCSCTEASDKTIDNEEQQSSIEEKDAKVDLKYGESSNVAVDVTVAELRKSPEKYHNLSVRIAGYASFEFEEFSIYDTFFEYDKQRYGAYNGLNRGIWLSYTGEDIESLGGTAGELITASGVPVVIEGVFDKEIHGMYGEYAGAVTRINLIETVDGTISELSVGKSRNAPVSSMSDILNSPEEFDNTAICVSGFLNIEFETNCLFISKEDYEESNLDNAIKLDIDFIKLKTNLSTLMEYNGKHVTVEGIYRCIDEYPSSFFGVIENISFIQAKESEC